VVARASGESLTHYAGVVDAAPPPHPDDLHWLRKDVGSLLPADYLAFMEQHDGAGGTEGDLWSAAEVGRGRDVCPEVDHLAELVVFGGNGGGEAFTFDADGQVVVIPWIGGAEDAIPQGSFTEFLARRFDQRP
jgi:SMI1 / KNR4 family (SUKH-1)